MFYEEKLINGILYYRNTPYSKWELLSMKQITKKYLNLKKDYNDLLSKETYNEEA